MRNTQNRVRARWAFGIAAAFCMFACGLGDPDQNHYNAVVSDDIRGIMFISELHWAGSVDNSGGNDRSDDCFIELYNSDILPRSLKGWTLRFTDDHGKILNLITIPDGCTIASRGRFTIGKDTEGAFSYFDFCAPALYIPRSRFKIEVQDAGGRTSDTVDFTKRDYLPGSALPNERRSIVRYVNAFDQPDANGYESWYVSASHPETSKQNIRTEYRKSMFCAPGKIKGSQYMWNPGVGNNATLAFPDADFEGASVPRASGSATATLSTAEHKIGAKSMHLTYSNASSNAALWVSTPLNSRGNRNLLTFWVKGWSLCQIRVLLSSAGTMNAGNRFYSFQANDSESLYVTGSINATIDTYRNDRISYGEWAQFVLELGDSSWYGSNDGIQLRIGDSFGGVRQCDMYFDDFMWASYAGDEDYVSGGGASGPALPPTAAFTGAGFEGGAQGATVPAGPSSPMGTASAVYETVQAKNGTGSMKVSNTGVANGAIYFSPSLLPRDTRNRLTFWVKGTASCTVRLLLTTSGTASTSNKCYDFTAADSNKAKVTGGITATSGSYAFSSITYTDWAQFVLALDTDSASYTGTSSIHLRLGGPSSDTTTTRTCELYFDDFMWEDSNYSP